MKDQMKLATPHESISLGGMNFHKFNYYPYRFNSRSLALPYQVFIGQKFIFLTIDDFLKYFSHT